MICTIIFIVHQIIIELHADIQDFLIECQPKLQKVFNNCSLYNTVASLAHLNVEAVKHFASLVDKSKRLIGIEHSDILKSSEAVGMVITNNIFNN